MFGLNLNHDNKEKGLESFVGVDIGSYAIKVVQITRSSANLTLDTYGELEMAAYDALPPGSITNLGEDKIITAIRDLFLAAKITAKKVVFGIPMEDCFISLITVPKVSEKELQSLVPIEARKYLPIPISEVKLNYWKVNIGNNDENNEDIVLAAVKNDTFELYSRYANKLGIIDYSFEIESLALARTILKQLKVNNINIENSSPILSVDIGGKITSVSLICNGSIRYTTLITKGSYDNTSQISKVLGITLDVAEEAKRIFGYIGDDSSPHLSEVMGLASYPLFDEVKHLLLQQERKYNIDIEKVVLSGGGALQKGIVELLSEFLEKEVVLVDSFSSYSLDENTKEAIKEEDEKYAVASGLAIKNLFN